MEGPLPPIREILYFQLNKMDLEPTQLAVLDVVESRLRLAPPGAQLVIEGHSDGLGPPPFNSSLSRMRAQTVRLYLIQRGISWRRLLIAGYGLVSTRRARRRRGRSSTQPARRVSADPQAAEVSTDSTVRYPGPPFYFRSRQARRTISLDGAAGVEVMVAHRAKELAPGSARHLDVGHHHVERRLVSAASAASPLLQETT